MIRKGLIEKLYDAASIQRWNDHVRPVEFTELDKQAHKMIISFVIAKFEEQQRKNNFDWMKIIEGGLFEFLQRVIMTDIKPPVFHKMMRTKGKELNRWVMGKLDADIKDLNVEFKDRFTSYLFDPEYAYFEKRILKAAHYLATNWEFKIIYHTSPFIYGIDRTKEEIENEIEDHLDIIGVQKISLGRKSYGFIDLCGQLRFQKRWAQTPRIPQTSVLGHMLIVAYLSYLCSYEAGACDKRKFNNFYASLFHDLPEILTRDIISPVKRSVEGLEEIITEYETIQLEQSILPLLPVYWHDEIRYFLEHQFNNRIIIDDEIILDISSREINERHNEAKFNPIDGELIKACDHLSAYIETALSISHGIKSIHLERGKQDIYEKNRGAEIAGINFGTFYDYFY